MKYFEQEKQYGDILYLEDVRNTTIDYTITSEPLPINEIKDTITNSMEKNIKTTVLKDSVSNITPIPEKELGITVLAPDLIGSSNFSDSASPGSTSQESKDSSWHDAQNTTVLNDLIKDCRNCRLGATRKNFVFGSGNHNADIMVIGEAPGADEDAQGLPFVGKAGQLLTKILESINLKRDEVFICNIIKCRPPENRRPMSDEVAECLPYLLKQIELIKPMFILALGATAVESLMGIKGKMADIRGRLIDFHGVQTLVTYPPAALLYNNALKRDVWEDVKFLRRLYDDYLKSVS